MTGDRLYLCLQAMTEQSTFLRAVHCLSSNPSRVGNAEWAETCFAHAGIADLKQKEILECADDGPTASIAMLSETFAIATELRLGESPTIFFGLTTAFGNATTPAIAAELAGRGLAPGTDVLYCGDRVGQDFIDATCEVVDTFKHGAALGAHLHIGEAECPLNSPEAEPECVDASVENGGGFVGVSPLYFLIFTLMIFTMHAVCLNLINRSQNRRREGSVSLRDPVSGSPRAGQPPLRGAAAAPQQRGLSAETVVSSQPTTFLLAIPGSILRDCFVFPGGVAPGGGAAGGQ